MKMSSSRPVVISAVIAALYMASVYLFAPISYGPLQLRVADLLKPLVLWNPLYSLGFGLGMFFANLGSPFGAWDFVAMPFVGVVAGLTAWSIRKIPALALVVHAVLISAGVAFFPLGLGGSLPFSATFPAVLISQLVITLAGYYGIWRWVKYAYQAQA